jgi:hypothetical protein
MADKSNKVASRVLNGANETVRRLNPGLFNPGATTSQTSQLGGMSKIIEDRRLRQDAKPLMNKLEQDWFNWLQARHNGNRTIRAQAKRYKLCNGAWYKPDITANIEGQEIAWECKGPKQMKSMARAMLVIKVAAAQWPEIKWILVWREAGEWKQQLVLP